MAHKTDSHCVCGHWWADHNDDESCALCGCDDLNQKRQTYENDEYGAMMARMIRAYGRRVGDGDEIDLVAMLEIRIELDDAIQAAVDGLRAQGHSWKYIADGAGITRQSAWERWSDGMFPITEVGAELRGD